jgi:hypothetical protein
MQYLITILLAVMKQPTISLRSSFHSQIGRRIRENLHDYDGHDTVLTQVLAIPLANELPTPNARKTCALSIWLLQVQRLPSEVLVPSGDRIAYALRRGMEGELGKEGKKGSASDGLKVCLTRFPYCLAR